MPSDTCTRKVSVPVKCVSGMYCIPSGILLLLLEVAVNIFLERLPCKGVAIIRQVSCSPTSSSFTANNSATETAAVFSQAASIAWVSNMNEGAIASILTLESAPVFFKVSRAIFPAKSVIVLLSADNNESNLIPFLSRSPSLAT